MTEANHLDTARFGPRIVRDLAWAVAAPPIVEVRWPPREVMGRRPHEVTEVPVPPHLVSDPALWPEHRFFRTTFETLKPHLKVLSDDPAPVMDVAGKTTDGRRGVYFERLTEYWLRLAGQGLDARDHRFLADVAVYEGNRTVGQFDFLMKENEETWTHIEVAVKYYLQRGPADRLHSWVGTNLVERMDQKLAHLLFHQIRLSQRHHSPVPVSRWQVYFKGLLFWKNRFRLWDNQPTVHSWWCTPEQFSRQAQSYPWVQWVEATKSEWFPGTRRDEIGETLSAEEMVETVRGRCKVRPVLVIGLDETGEVARGCLFDQE